MERYLPTGSELLSLPRVNEKNGAVEDLGFLHMGSRGLIELRGGRGGAADAALRGAGRGRGRAVGF